MGNRFSGIIGSLIMLFFGAMSFYRFYTTGIIFFLLMVLRDVIAAWFLFSRRGKIDENSSKKIAVVAYFSSAIPLFYFKGASTSSVLVAVASMISILGFLVSTLALIELGKSFGVSPANRGQVTTGVYRFTKHPMYLGYVISEFSFLLFNSSNVLIYLISMSLYLYRAKVEELCLNSDN